MSKIKCELCGDMIHAVQKHLRDEHHTNSAVPCTLTEYRERFPNAPLMSQALIEANEKRKAEAAAQAAGAGVAIPAAASVPGAAKQPMSKLFRLGNAKAARTLTGDEIMISVCQQTGHEDRIPVYDNGYVYNIDVLKNLLLAIEMNMPAYTFGPAGTGKTSIIKQICAATNRRMVRIQHSINLEESHVLGKWIVKRDPETNTTATVFQPGPLALAMRFGWVYVADEYDRADPGVLSVYQAVLEGDRLIINDADEEWSRVDPHPDFRFMATGNTNGSGDDSGLFQATIQQDAANIERFGVVQLLSYPGSKEEIASIRMQSGVSEKDAKNIQRFAEDMRRMYPAEISIPLGVRVAINIGKIGIAKDNFQKGVELAYANRLPEAEREVALQYAQRIFS